MHTAPGKYDFATADKYVAFAEAHDMKMVGHNLLWHQQTPTFLFVDADQKPSSRETALANLKDHITTAVTHFKGKVIGWDVVNEAIADSGPLQDKNGPAEFDRAICDFEELGLEVMITELDGDVLPRQSTVANISATEQDADPYKAGLPADVAAAQGQYYADLFRVFVRHPALTRVTLWGTHDGTSWLNNWPVRGRTNYGLLWMRDLSPKPALTDVMAVLAGK